MNEHIAALQARQKPSKFRNHITFVDGLRFQSKAEANRWCELQLLERAGQIKNLRRQVPFNCVVNKIEVCKYIADFSYEEGGEFVAEDMKGCVTALFNLKAKLIYACHGFKIKVTKARRR